ncbi:MULTISPECIES: succinylglutamate desuccinylase/aspartoacylase family protein [unclassified Oleiphilus]|jgi:hypothetical protein|uniref:succinylglutamate desuccinylase/aspartoacylase domain-containing protein n=4 Tax=Oleiphilus TaxID=141450 RepID=UPI0007C31997|nr:MULTISPECIES: succinylglutamate desuccinylase/aspartoacylase family protein [unclassified Oleiphilus]KZY45731.1 hypothetical protein A3732_09555 [Oleiphilus sp. HI0050]KZY76977.1 hypothetical protein A3741_10165 [Oleiphilus sp. HI0069]KZY84720.1 hypothetical protein A3740_21020 [Oleiphilus sp. HI0068]KZY95378.1 hypothetical protein A3743_05525 [Oleiphilus sp. HI0072]KZZ10992.1 hypothetical protein A3749_09890 [Oleiphilus sp. HI0078]KZZ19425.1 hypothetical protein A3752_14580 [Oleiphilus sp
MSIELNRFCDPDPSSIGEDIYQFLDYLGGPSEILLSGDDTTRTRAFVTLLHGNEPSGLIALFKWLKSGLKPAVNVVCIVASVSAASLEPSFSHRVFARQRDLNRCFKEPFDDEPGYLAAEILETLKRYKPESLIDMHNTSGSGPSFAVAIYEDPQHDALTELFTKRLIVTHLRLGALMEVTEYLCPTVTIECGGRLDESAHQIAWEGLNRYFRLESVLAGQESQESLEVLTNPVRLELKDDCRLRYGEKLSEESDLCLLPSIEQLNSGITVKDTQLGWVATDDLKAVFSSKNSREECVVNELVYIKDGGLFAKRDLKLFMITNNPEIAKMDCLFYAVRDCGSEVVAELS